jgi:hypothetical protein
LTNCLAGNNAGKCLRADNANGAAVVLTDCTGGSDQEWTFQNGQVTLYNGAKCLNVPNGQNVDGVKMQILDCSQNNPNQQFTYTGWGGNL